MSGTPVFPSTNRAKTIGRYVTANYLTDGYFANVQLWTLDSFPGVVKMNASAARIAAGGMPCW